MNDLITQLKDITNSFESQIKEGKCGVVGSILDNYSSYDWKQYVKIGKDTYNKNKVFQNDLFEVYVITWNAGQKSKIHNHPSICYFKVLQGTIFENVVDVEYKSIISRELYKDYIGFINDDIGYHSVENKTKEIAVTLHIYSAIALAVAPIKYR